MKESTVPDTARAGVRLTDGAARFAPPRDQITVNRIGETAETRRRYDRSDGRRAGARR
jgi:hypothetical protein